MRLSTLCLCLCFACLVPASAFARQAPSPASTEVASLKALPAEIRAALGSEIADRGEPFAEGCVSAHGEPNSRFSAAQVGDDTAQIRIERGGRAHFVDTLAFRKVDGHWVALPRGAQAARD